MLRIAPIGTAILLAGSVLSCGTNSKITLAQLPGPTPAPTGGDTPVLAPSPSPTPPGTKPPGGHIPGEQGVCGSLYDISKIDRTKLPDFDKLVPVGRAILPQFNIACRTYTRPFPGVPEDMLEWYAIRFRGHLLVPLTGLYEFRLRSDDGSKLVLDNKIVIDNDGIHSSLFAKEGRMQLSSGSHDLELQYFQGPKHYIALELSWTPPDQLGDIIIPAAALEGLGSDDRDCF
jgi:hypothetical protein